MDSPADRGELWRLALEHSPVGMALVDLDGRILLVNHALCEMLGYEAEQLLDKGFQEITHPDDLEADLELFGRTLAGAIDSYRIRKRYRRSDGQIVWGDLSVALQRDEDGQPLHFISQVLDVTELEHERRTLEAIFETVDVGLLLIDQDGRYQRMNRRHADSMLMPFPDGHAGMAGQLGDVYRADGQTLMAREEMPSFRAAQGEEFRDLRLWVGEDPATRRAFSISARSVREPDGEMTGAVLAYQDITDLMRAMQVKDDFVASVSHELRTPLTSVLGHLELLVDRDDLPFDVAKEIAVVERNALRLRALVSDLLHVAQARGGVQVHLTEMDLRMLVLDAAEAARPAAAAQGLDLVIDVPERLGAVVDPHRIRQVVDNLISNAIKYTDRGGSVTVTLHRVGHQVELAVADTGMGIEPEDVDQVFTRFYRGREAQSRQIQGTGLGLSIVSSIVSAHGGTISLESERGVGTTFRVKLPHAVIQ